MRRRRPHPGGGACGAPLSARMTRYPPEQPPCCRPHTIAPLRSFYAPARRRAPAHRGGGAAPTPPRARRTLAPPPIPFWAPSPPSFAVPPARARARALPAPPVHTPTVHPPPSCTSAIAAPHVWVGEDGEEGGEEGGGEELIISSRSQWDCPWGKRSQPHPPTGADSRPPPSPDPAQYPRWADQALPHALGLPATCYAALSGAAAPAARRRRSRPLASQPTQQSHTQARSAEELHTAASPLQKPPARPSSMSPGPACASCRRRCSHEWRGW